MRTKSEQVLDAKGEYNVALTEWQESMAPMGESAEDDWQGLMRDVYQIEQRIEQFISRYEHAFPPARSGGGRFGCACPRKRR